MEKKKCLLCGNYDSKNNILHNIQYSSSDKRSIIKCSDCGIIYQLPFAEKFEDYSGAYYYFSQYPKKAVISDIQKGIFISRIIKKYFPAGKSVFDIGAAAGIVLNTVSRFGYIPSGIEISEAGVKLAEKYYGLTIEKADIESYSKTINADIVTMTDVIEHTENPFDTLKKIFAQMKSGAALIIEAPNIGSLYYSLNPRYWAGFNRFHNYHFTPQTIKELSCRAGFFVVDIFTANFNLLSLEGFWRIGFQDLLIKLLKKKTDEKNVISNKYIEAKFENINLTIQEIPVYKKLIDIINYPLNLIAQKFNWGDQLWILLKK